MDAHAEDDAEFRVWPPHCVAGTLGQRKPAQTLLERQAVVPNRPARVEIAGAPQIILEKDTLDLFTNPNIRDLLAAAGGDRYVVYGVVTEYCVRCAVLGLLATGKPVSLVTDAIQTLNRADAERTFAEFADRGGTLTSVSEVCAR
jgi:nicotinamidase/pyrazinamidase